MYLKDVRLNVMAGKKCDTKFRVVRLPETEINPRNFLPFFLGQRDTLLFFFFSRMAQINTNLKNGLKMKKNLSNEFDI